MFTYEVLLAAALVPAPADSPVAAQAGAWADWLSPSLIHLSLQAEIIDRREAPFLLVKRVDFPADVKFLRSRWDELEHAPLVEESYRFPERRLVHDFLSFNRAYRCDLVARLAVDPVHAEELKHALDETDRLYNIWDAVRDARCEYYYVHVRRQSLQLLRDLVGLEAFYNGHLPPHVPVWRFPLAQ